MRSPDAEMAADAAERGASGMSRATDNVRLEVIDGNGEKVPVHIPYYIITDALEDGLTSAGLFVEIEEFIEANYHLNAWDFTEQSEKEIEGLASR